MHTFFFERALREAQKVKGLVSPNPAVGSVLVKGDQILGIGATEAHGGRHAEQVALDEAGERSAGSDLYVTLEPCVDFVGKRTASCSQSIIRAGVKRVFIGHLDRNPAVLGKGVAALRQAGIQVVFVPGFEKELMDLNEDFYYAIRHQSPFVTAKYAMTLDGSIATTSGSSQWISSDASRVWVHQVRSCLDAIMVGVGTVAQDNPQLTARHVLSVRQPLRVILDPHGRTPLGSHVLRDEYASVFLCTEPGFQKLEPYLAAGGKSCLLIDLPLQWETVLQRLHDQCGIQSLQMEGGGKMLYSAWHQGAIHKLQVIVAPKVLGGKGISPFEGLAPPLMEHALNLQSVQIRPLGADILVEGYLRSLEDLGLLAEGADVSPLKEE